MHWSSKHTGRKILPTEATFSPQWNFIQHYYPGHSHFFISKISFTSAFICSSFPQLRGYLICLPSDECAIHLSGCVYTGSCLQSTKKGLLFRTLLSKSIGPWVYSLYSLPSTLPEKFHIELSPLVHHLSEEVRKEQRVLRIQIRGEIFSTRKELHIQWTLCTSLLSSRLSKTRKQTIPLGS